MHIQVLSGAATCVFETGPPASLLAVPWGSRLAFAAVGDTEDGVGDTEDSLRGAWPLSQAEKGTFIGSAPVPALLGDFLTALSEGGDGSGSHRTLAGKTGGGTAIRGPLDS